MSTDYRGLICKAVQDGKCTTVSGMMDHLDITDRMAEFLVGKLVKDGALTRKGDGLTMKSVAQVTALAKAAPVSHAAEPEHDIPPMKPKAPPKVSGLIEMKADRIILHPPAPIEPSVAAQTFAGNVEFVQGPLRETPAPKSQGGRLREQPGPKRPPRVSPGLLDVLDTAVQLQDNVPKPERPSNKAGRFPLAAMELGQMFNVKVPHGFTAMQVAALLKMDIGNYRHRVASRHKRFSIRTIDDKNVGVWRDPDGTTDVGDGVSSHG